MQPQRIFSVICFYQNNNGEQCIFGLSSKRRTLHGYSVIRRSGISLFYTIDGVKCPDVIPLTVIKPSDAPVIYLDGSISLLGEYMATFYKGTDDRLEIGSVRSVFKDEAIKFRKWMIHFLCDNGYKKYKGGIWILPEDKRQDSGR